MYKKKDCKTFTRLLLDSNFVSIADMMGGVGEEEESELNARMTSFLFYLIKA